MMRKTQGEGQGRVGYAGAQMGEQWEGAVTGQSTKGDQCSRSIMMRRV